MPKKKLLHSEVASRGGKKILKLRGKKYFSGLAKKRWEDRKLLAESKKK